jgi:type I restriction enzyme S subunit
MAKKSPRVPASPRESEKEDGNPTLVPKLRFPEFRDAQGWTLSQLSELLVSAPDYGVNAAAVAYSEKLPKYLRITDISDEGHYISEKPVSVAIEPESSNYLEDGDVVLARTGASVGKSYRYRQHDGKLVFAGFLIRVRPNPNCLLPTYLCSFLTTSQYWKWVAKTSARSGQPGINSTEYGSLPIPLPKIFAEQHKIASCLSSLDELIGAQGRKVDALRTHKKGLMQQLFPREGETQPRLRFPEFQNAGDWEIRQLSDFITERNEFPKEKVPLFSLTIEDGVTPKTERYERSFLVNDEADAYKLVLPNDFAINPMNLRFGAIGRHSGIEKVAVSKYYNIFSCDDTVDSRFCETYFRSERMIAFYDEMAIGTLIEKRRVHFASFLKFNIRFPSLIEQQRIATCLSSLDDLITAETQKLEALKTHKRGLMQQLFPSPEEN